MIMHDLYRAIPRLVRGVLLRLIAVLCQRKCWPRVFFRRWDLRLCDDLDSTDLDFSLLLLRNEMVCALFHTTAHVTCLFQSLDPKNPRVMYGNTCAHAMNVASMASVLPRTPSDINDALSVVFIGNLNQKFDPLCIYSLFCV